MSFLLIHKKILSSYAWHGMAENIRPYNYRCPRQSLGLLLPAIKNGTEQLSSLLFCIYIDFRTVYI